MRFFALILCQLLLWGITAVINYYLAPWHVYVVTGGLHVAFAALMLSPGLAFGTSFFAGLLLDAGSPVPFGMHGWLLGVAAIILSMSRQRLAREETSVQIGIALLVNFAVFVVVTAALLHNSPTPGSVLLRLLWDMLWSQILIAVIAPWFNALQAHAVDLAAPAFLREKNDRI